MSDQDQKTMLGVNELSLPHDEQKLIPGATSITCNIAHAVVIKGCCAPISEIGAGIALHKGGS